MPTFDELNESMGLLKSATQKDNKKQTGNLNDFYVFTPVIASVTTVSVEDLNQFEEESDVDGDVEIRSDGENGSGFEVEAVDNEVTEKAIFNPSKALGRNGNYIQNIRTALKARDLSSSRMGLDDEGNGKWDESDEVGDPDYLSTSKILKSDDLTDPIEVAENIGKYSSSQKKDNKEYQALPDAVKDYKVSDEAKSILKKYTTGDAESWVAELVNVPYQSSIKNASSYESTVDNLLTKTNTETDTERSKNSVNWANQQLTEAASLSEEEYQSIIRNILK